MREVVIVDSVRTGLAKSFRGKFNLTRPDDMAAHCVDALLARNDLDPLLVDDCIVGAGSNEGAQGHNIGRNVAVLSGLGIQVPGMTLNRYCSSGLQAIATAKRLGAVIEASDVRPAVKEQIESLGAKFVDVPYETDEERECAEGVGGYARPMPASWMERQAKAVHERAKQSDIVITTALIPGRKAPTLLHEATVAEMKPGSVVIDLAAAQGGNCPLTEADQVVVRHGVTIVGHSNLAALVPADASALYARNILDFLKLTLNAEGFSVNLEDDIVAACLMCRDGQAVRKNG